MFTVLCFAAVLVASASAACRRSVSCPCGTSNKNYTFCTDGLTLEGNNPCARWSQCETCQEGVPVCIKCPSGRSGAICTTVPVRKTTRKKRQYQYQRHDDIGSSTMQIGSCPPLKSPSPGTISCTKYSNYGDCTGRCVPGYNFEGDEDKKEITLNCRRGSWHPLPYYPPCISDNYCELVGRENSKFNCTIGVDGTRCDISCHWRYQGRYFCFPGRSWKPTLPYCVVSKVSSVNTPPCPCQNGGTCDQRGSCTCPIGWTGEYCEYTKSATCPDPGFLRGSDRTNADGSVTSYPRTYREKEFVVYSCKNTGVALVGKPLITCTEDGTWSAPLPKCVTSQGTVCQDPGQVRFAKRLNQDWTPSDTSRTYSINQFVAYTCQPGYQLHGSNVLTCLQSGAWSRKRPTCQPDVTSSTTASPPAVEVISCKHPGVDKNGEITTSLFDSRSRIETRFPAGTQLTYACKDGFELFGVRILHCLLTGAWTHPPPTCEPKLPPSEVIRSCPYLGDVRNGQVNPRVLGNQVQALTQLTIKCNKGYKLQGANVVFCQPDGSWSNDFPICREDFSEPAGNGITCPHPGVDEYGMMDVRMIDPRNSGKSRFEPGTRVRYSCKEGYFLYGMPNIYCLNTGVWSDKAPTCEIQARNRNDEPEMDCGHLDSIANGRVVAVVYRTFEAQLPSGAEFEDSADMEHPVGTKLFYSCEIGYTLIGPKSLVCEESGSWSDNPPSCVEDCGLSIVEANRRVTNGEKTEPGEWPWMVDISVPTRNNRSAMICGGALLDRRTVLTAAHCFSNHSYYILHFGKFHKRDIAENGGVEMRRSIQIIIHQQFNRTTFVNDIALVRLESEVRYNERILPICLPTPETTKVNLVPGNLGIVTGWGITETGLTADELMMAKLPVQSDGRCMNAYRRQGLHIRIGSGMFCAGFRQGVTSACRGDSGSPFVFYNSTSKRYTIEGCVSFSVLGQCGIAERYTMFSKILHFMPWINRNWPK